MLQNKTVSSRIVGAPKVAAVNRSSGVCAARRSHKQRVPLCRAAPAANQPDISSSIDEDTIASGEWPANWSLASYEDVSEYYAGKLFKDGLPPTNNVKAIMETKPTCVSEDDAVASATNAVKLLSTVPVINASGQCVGMLSMSDLSKGGKTVKDVMTSPAITVKRGNSVAEAAAVMLKYKVDALPVVDKDGAVVGAVSRTDMFTALESMEE